MATALWEQVKDLNTAATQPWDAKTLSRCDPYLVWADAATRPPSPPGPSGTSQKPPKEDKLAIAVLVELNDAADYGEFLDRMNHGAFNLAELRFVPNGFEPHGLAPHGASRFITGLVNRKGLAALVSDVGAKLIDRFELQDPRWGIAQVAQAEWEKCHGTKPPTDAAKDAAPARPAAVKSSAGTYLGIIDDGLPVLRVRESIQSTTQPAHFWDQGWQSPESMANTVALPSPKDPYWRVAWGFRAAGDAPATPANPIRPDFRARGFLYGRLLKPLPAMSAARSGDRNDYTRIRYVHPAPRRSHGAGVLGLLAPWLSGARHPVRWPEQVSGLAMVQLPTRTVIDTSGGSLAMRVIDALRFILWREEQDRPDLHGPRPIVANISYGVHAGPHDGTSMFERAVLEMLEANHHLHVVLPAGNAARAGCHARRLLSRRGEAGDRATFMLDVLPDNRRDTFVELWLPEGAAVSLAIRPPGSDAVYRLVGGEARICFEPLPTDPATPRTVRFGAVYPRQVAQGQHGTMILVAIGPTQRVRAEVGGPARGLNQRRRRDVAGGSGLWALEVQNLSAHPVVVNARVERGDAPPDAAEGSRQAYFPDSCHRRVRLGNSTPEDTLNGIATLRHARLHVVGAMRADGPLTDYSAAGSAWPGSASRGPTAVAPADASGNLPGLRTIGFAPGAAGRINGTSAASAVYARALAAQLATDPAHKPDAPAPVELPPEITCVADSQPQGPADLRGQAERKLFRFEVDL
jgi:hypothetical protein